MSQNGQIFYQFQQNSVQILCYILLKESEAKKSLTMKSTFVIKKKICLS